MEDEWRMHGRCMEDEWRMHEERMEDAWKNAPAVEWAFFLDGVTGSNRRKQYTGASIFSFFLSISLFFSFLSLRPIKARSLLEATGDEDSRVAGRQQLLRHHRSHPLLPRGTC